MIELSYEHSNFPLILSIETAYRLPGCHMETLTLVTTAIEHIVILIAIEETIVHHEIIHLRYCFDKSCDLCDERKTKKLQILPMLSQVVTMSQIVYLINVHWLEWRRLANYIYSWIIN